MTIEAKFDMWQHVWTAEEGEIICLKILEISTDTRWCGEGDGVLTKIKYLCKDNDFHKAEWYDEDVLFNTIEELVDRLLKYKSYKSK